MDEVGFEPQQFRKSAGDTHKFGHVAKLQGVSLRESQG